MNGIYLILYNIRSLHNVGSIFRTADAVGIKRIYLAGYTPTPIDRFGKIKPEIKKTALGAEKTVEWKNYRNVYALIKKLKKEKINIIAVEQNKNSTNYKKAKIKFPVAFVFGNEVKGISNSILKKCKKIIEIPTYGRKESLNVSVAVGIIVFSFKK